jgi:hypothetical protein
MTANDARAAGTFSPVQKKSGMAGSMIVSAGLLFSVLPADGKSIARRRTMLFFPTVDDNQVDIVGGMILEEK